ncbi:hypothetical protein DIZ76_016932 [Coccidioides immitis]|nr:hypothetical protein DIZ76_016932 [Coccidioides immitis]
MNPKVEIDSGAILDSHEASSAVLQALIHDGWVIFKGAANTESIDAARENKPVCDLLAKASPDIKCLVDYHMRASILEHSEIGGPPERQQQKLWQRRAEVLAVTCFHLLGKETNQWEWEYDRRDFGRQDESRKTVRANGGDVYVDSQPHRFRPLLIPYRIVCNGWLPRRLPKPRDKTDLYLINYTQMVEE